MMQTLPSLVIRDVIVMTTISEDKVGIMTILDLQYDIHTYKDYSARCDYLGHG